MSLTHVRSTTRYSKTCRPTFTFLRQNSTPPVGYRTLDVSTTDASTILLLVIPGYQGWLW